MECRTGGFRVIREIRWLATSRGAARIACWMNGSCGNAIFRQYHFEFDRTDCCVLHAPGAFWGDPNRLRQMWNLREFAVKSRRAEGESRSIQLR